MQPTVTAQAVHSAFGGSVFDKILNCGGYIRMTAGIPGSSNDAAEKGTAVHEAIEFAGRMGLDVTDLVGLVFNAWEITPEMAEAGQVFVAYMRLLQTQTGCAPMWEQRVTIFSIGNDVYGTADGMLIDLTNRRLYVLDYKNGYGLVEATSTQFVFYALGALDTFQLWDQIDEVVTVVVQPNVDHVDGSVRSHEYTIQEMREKQVEFKAAVDLARQPDAPTVAGKHCQWCKAAGHCRSRMMRTLEMALPDKPVDTLSPEEVSVVFNEIKVIENQLKAIAAKAVEHSRNGHDIAGHKLVKSIVRAKCDDPELFIKEAVARGIPEAALLQRKTKPMSQLKKLVPVDLVNQHFVKPEAGTTLAPLSDKRPAISKTQETPSAAGIFTAV